MPRKYVRKTDRELTPEHRANIAAAARKRYSDPEERAKTAATLREVYADPAKRAEAAEKSRNYHSRAKAALALLAEQEANGG
jgi:hypothetical protein